MGFLNLGSAAKFHYLGNQDQMLVVDLHLFMADQVRFEMMRRLGWIKEFEGLNFSILEWVQKFDSAKEACRINPPVLSASNPDFAEYSRLSFGDKQVLIRRMLSQALDAFKNRL